MAEVLTITKDDTAESIKKKLLDLNAKPFAEGKGFKAKNFTGKIKSFENGVEFQRKIRNEWN